MNNIIKFEIRKTSENAPGGSAPNPIHRRNMAIARMAAAQANNRVAVAGFQAVMGTLERTVKNLENSCEKYLRKLDRIKVRRLRRRSLRLAEIMDGWLENHDVANTRPI